MSYIFRLDRNATTLYQVKFYASRSAGEPKVPLDLTGMGVVMNIVPQEADPFTITVDGGNADPELRIPVPANGQVTLYISVPKMQSYTWTSARVYFALTDTLGNVHTRLRGARIAIE